MAPLSAVTGVIALLAGATAVNVPPTGDGVDADSLSLLQTRAQFFFWSQPEPSPEPANASLALNETDQGNASAHASSAAVPKKAEKESKDKEAEKAEKDKAGQKSLESELTDFISNVKSPEFISHEAVRNTGQDCWEHCSKKGGLCDWCGKGNSCCRKNWNLNPSECTGVTAYKTKKHECVGPAPGAKGAFLMLDNSSMQSTDKAATVADVIYTDLAFGAAALNGTANSTGELGQEINASSNKSKTGVRYHDGDAEKDSRDLPEDGTKAPLTSWGFSVVSGLQSSPEMSRFVKRLIGSLHCRVVSDDDYHAFLAYMEDKDETYDNLVKELKELCGDEAGGSWLERAESQDASDDSVTPTEMASNNVSLVSTSSDDMSVAVGNESKAPVEMVSDIAASVALALNLTDKE